MPTEHPIQSWINILRPSIEKELGEMPSYTIETQDTDTLSPWGVFTDNKEILFVYNPKNIESLFLNPPPGEEPHPNAMGRLIWDLIHDLCHIYQAEALYFYNNLRFFMHRGYDLSLDGLAEFATLKICTKLWQQSNDETAKVRPPLTRKAVTNILKSHGYRQSLEAHIMRSLVFAFKTAVHSQNTHTKGLIYNTLIAILPKNLKHRAKFEILLMEQGDKMKDEPKEHFKIYDLGIYLGALLEKELGLNLDKMINNPRPDKELLDLVKIQK